MKRLKITLALLAVIFAVASAFTTTQSGYTGWQKATSTGLVQVGDLPNDPTLHCPPAEGVFCLQRYDDGTPQTGFADIYESDDYFIENPQ